MSSRVKFLTNEEINNMTEDEVKISIKNYRARLNFLAKLSKRTEAQDAEIDRKEAILAYLYASINTEPRSPVKHLAGISGSDEEIRGGLDQCEEDEDGNIVVYLTPGQYNDYRLIIERYLDRKEYTREKNKERYEKMRATQTPKKPSPRRRTGVKSSA